MSKHPQRLASLFACLSMLMLVITVSFLALLDHSPALFASVLCQADETLYINVIADDSATLGQSETVNLSKKQVYCATHGAERDITPRWTMLRLLVPLLTSVVAGLLMALSVRALPYLVKPPLGEDTSTP